MRGATTPESTEVVGAARRVRAGHGTRSRSAEPVAACQPREKELEGLIGRFCAGDQTALATLYDATKSVVHGLALRILRDPEAAEEVTMEVYTQVLQQAGQYNPARGTPSAWLLTLTRSRAIDHWRVESLRQQREESLETVDLPSPLPDPESSNATAEIRRMVRMALATLGPEQRQVLETAYYAGLSHNEIAATLGQPLGTVKSRIRSGMIVLRNLLGPLLAES